ncbi:uncharacterized protein LOC130949952 [Arachis stenosperma]|uniref:uncharacterized protein LOC130949952 n=1 Tax=Arachis stenosperma TaxID=217475 RepID=UPI0025AD2B7F|nr:uncharacterized protein LOC130949952 [Arachis stenosperma]
MPGKMQWYYPLAPVKSSKLREIILDMAKSLTFPLPLLATTHQQLIHGISNVSCGEDDSTSLIKVWEKIYGVKVLDAANEDLYSAEKLASKITSDSKSGRRVGCMNKNTTYTKFISLLAHSKGILVEAELGRLSGTKDDLTMEEYEAKLTYVKMAEKFIDEMGIDALAVCIGNMHGKYPASGPNLKFNLLKIELHALSWKKGVFLVLHGASGLSEELVKKDLVHVMASAKEAMKVIVAEKMHLFGLAGNSSAVLLPPPPLPPSISSDKDFDDDENEDDTEDYS